jgi:NAD(P)-dependent dehydrogenase (short-subunit alcohol dehydrogenase family)
MNYVVITGVSTGIGYAAVKELLAKGFYIFGSVRNTRDAQRLKKDFGDSFTPLIFDVTDHERIDEAVAEVADHIGTENLRGLVNNAGISVSGPLMHIPIDRVRYQMEVNCIGVLKVTQAFLPLLGTNRQRSGKPGRIINISSVSGRFAYPFVGPYAASKYALEAISDSLRRELFLYDIDVILIEPGSVDTPIWEKLPDYSIYDKTDYYPILERLKAMMLKHKKEWMSDAVVAKTIYRAITTNRPKTRYLLVKNKFKNGILLRLLPDRWLDKIIINELKK